MTRGISTNRCTTTLTTLLKQNGIEFVFRYYSRTTQQPEKRLTRSEAEALSDVGILIGVVYEDNPTSLSYFSASRGHLDGVNAYHYALELHQPPGSSAIYFTVDYDASSSDISGSILDYFRGINQGMRDAAGTDTPNYLVGIYGSGAACTFIRSHCPFAKYSWLAESKGWLGSKGYLAWDVSQAVATANLGSLTSDQYEDNQARTEFGGFTLADFPPAIAT